VAQADVIIEAIFENLEAKRALFADIERRARPDAVLASNTSSLRIADIAVALLVDRAGWWASTFFNPVAVMPLVEVVRTAGTFDETYRALRPVRAQARQAAAAGAGRARFSGQCGAWPLYVRGPALRG
jgi:3-hydroxyacyl-CoA dehydrogenase